MERRVSGGVIGDFAPEFPPHPATASALRRSAAATSESPHPLITANLRTTLT